MQHKNFFINLYTYNFQTKIMKTKINQVTLFLFTLILFIQTGYSQEESRYELTLNTEYNGIKSKLKLSSISYSLSNYAVLPVDSEVVQKPEPIYINVTTSESVNKDFFKIFESAKGKVNGVIEIKDNFGKNPLRKFEFKKSSLILSESISTYSTGNSINISIYGESMVMDGVAIFSKP